jgi:site-specific recombinase XerC
MEQLELSLLVRRPFKLHCSHVVDLHQIPDVEKALSCGVWRDARGCCASKNAQLFNKRSAFGYERPVVRLQQRLRRHRVEDGQTAHVVSHQVPHGFIYR